MKSHIIDEMLKKAEKAEKDGDIKLADHWFRRAEEAEKTIERIYKKNENQGM